MRPTFVERCILHNQYRILAALEPENRTYHERRAEALKFGYTLAYGMGETVELEEMSEDVCRETMDILDMFSALERSYETLKDQGGIDAYRVRFRGFDGNHDRQFGFARFLRDDGRWTWLFRSGGDANNDDGNSHGPVLDGYRAMLAQWRVSADKFNLTRDDIIRIASAE